MNENGGTRPMLPGGSVHVSEYVNQMSCMLNCMSAINPPAFTSEAVELGTTTMLRLHGELDLHYESQVTAEVQRVLGRHPETVAVDLRGLDFMDSSGIRAVVVAERSCRSQGARFLLIRGSEAIDRLLVLCGLERHFEMIAGPELLPIAA